MRKFRRWRRATICRIFGHPWRNYPIASRANGITICDRCYQLKKGGR